MGNIMSLNICPASMQCSSQKLADLNYKCCLPTRGTLFQQAWSVYEAEIGIGYGKEGKFCLRSCETLVRQANSDIH